MVGLYGLRAILAAVDGGPQTRMQAMLAEQHGIETPEELMRRVYQEEWPVPQVAPLVLEAAMAGDEPAQRIVQEQTYQLARLISWLGKRCEAINKQVALVGGLSKNEYYHNAFSEALQELLPGWQLKAPLHRPVIGAWQLAQRAAQQA